MALVIRKLETKCRIPRKVRNAAEVVDQFARGRFASDLAAHLGPSLSRQPAVVRIRRLPVRVVIPASELNEASLSKAWTAAFGRALFQALAYPSGLGPFEVFRAESAAKFIAGAIRDLLDGRTSASWQYEEFRDAFTLGMTEGAVRLLTHWPELCAEILVELDQAESLDKLLPRLDDLALERMFRPLAAPGESERRPLDLDDLVRCGKLVLEHPPQKLSTMRSRSFALKLFVRAYLAREYARSPRTIFHVASAWAILLSDDLPQLSSILQDGPVVERFPAETVALLRALAHEVRHFPQSAGLTQVKQVLEDLRSSLHLPPPSASEKPSRVISSDWCGLFFLVGTLERLDWARAWQTLPEFHVGGVSPLLVGLAMTIAGQFDASLSRLEPGLALFSGYFDEPDLRHVRSVFEEFSTEARRKVLRAAIESDESAETWQSLFAKLADTLLRRFTEAIPGFRRSTPGSIVRTFLQRKGRIRIEERRIVVEPEPSAFHLALHIAGLDAPISEVSWFGGRSLEFAIEEP
jgi:hypothetical protein